METTIAIVEIIVAGFLVIYFIFKEVKYKTKYLKLKNKYKDLEKLRDDDSYYRNSYLKRLDDCNRARRGVNKALDRSVEKTNKLKDENEKVKSILKDVKETGLKFAMLWHYIEKEEQEVVEIFKGVDKLARVLISKVNKL